MISLRFVVSMAVFTAVNGIADTPLPPVGPQGSFLQFRLQKLQYITLLQQSRVKEAILYARLHFGRFLQAYVDREGEGSGRRATVPTLAAVGDARVGLELW